MSDNILGTMQSNLLITLQLALSTVVGNEVAKDSDHRLRPAVESNWSKRPTRSSSPRQSPAPPPPCSHSSCTGSHETDTPSSVHLRYAYSQKSHFMLTCGNRTLCLQKSCLLADISLYAYSQKSHYMLTRRNLTLCLLAELSLYANLQEYRFMLTRRNLTLC